MSVRRDPRGERDARKIESRSGLPRFTIAPVEAGTSRRRIDPRAARDARRVSSHGRPRFGLVTALNPGKIADPVSSEARARPIRIVETPDFLVLAVPDRSFGASDADTQAVINAAHRLCAGSNGAVCVLSEPGDPDYGAVGADRVLQLPLERTTAASISRLIDQFPIRHVVFAESPEGADLARQTAARTGTRLFAAAERISEGQASRRCDGGKMELTAELPLVVSILPHIFRGEAKEAGEARPITVDPALQGAETPLARPRLLEADPSALSLSEAEFILSAGDGVTDWEGFSTLGDLLGAALGGSRNVCDAGHLPRDRQIGASGTIVTAKCYLALGISGAPQHLQGISDVQHVVAVNTDLHSAMIKRADLSIIADAQEVIPALIDRLKREEGRDD
ncbi:MAG: electron transfer flavoprotein subunit alpha/FixB family protein [Hyphomonadaceae bacterium]|nr:electron transfer flavoprotein subunit alpha/FixB family protein [Hyphomonadaceae bacterium]